MNENLARQYQPAGFLQKELERKNDLLREKFLELTPQDYLNLVFPDKEELIVVLGSIKDKQGNVIESGGHLGDSLAV